MNFIYALSWALVEALVLLTLIVFTKYYKNLKDLSVEEKKEGAEKQSSVNEKVNSFLVKNRTVIRWTTIVVLTVFAGLCGFIEYGNSNLVLTHLRLLIIYCSLSVIAITDFKKYIIPNSVIIFMIASGAIILIPEFFTKKAETFKNGLLNYILSFVIAFVVLLLISLVSKGGFGMGDIKLFACIGLLGGMYCVINTLMFSLIFCAIFSGILLIAKAKSIKDLIPFGPFIYAGFVLSVLLGSV